MALGPTRRTLSFILAAALGWTASACLEEEPPPTVPPEALMPVPLERPKLTPEQEQAAKLKAFRAHFSPDLLEALDFMDWGPLEEGAARPQLAYGAGASEDCPVRYAQNVNLRNVNDRGGMFQTNAFVTFFLETSAAPKSGQPQAAYAPELFSAIFSYTGQKNTTIYQLGAQSMHRRVFSLGAPETFFGALESPVFLASYMGIDLSEASKTGSPPKKLARGSGTARQETADLHAIPNFFPALPKGTEPGAEAEWAYNPLFDANMPTAKRPKGKVRLETWLRVRTHSAALLKVTWPADGQEWQAAKNIRPMFHVIGKLSSKTFLKQQGDMTAEFVVSDTGEVLLARFQGVVLQSTDSVFVKNDPYASRFRSRRRASEGDKARINDREEIYFSFLLKAQKDCEGDFLRKADIGPLSADRLRELTEEFASLYTIGRKKDALALLTPLIRYLYSDDQIIHFLDMHFKVGGIDSIGRPAGEIVVNDADGLMDDFGHGLIWEGLNKTLNTPTYSFSRGHALGGRPYLTFLGVSTRPDRRSWDLLELAPGRIHTIVLHEKEHPFFEPGPAQEEPQGSPADLSKLMQEMQRQQRQQNRAHQRSSSAMPGKGPRSKVLNVPPGATPKKQVKRP